jgi:hypothetical protein
MKLHYCRPKWGAALDRLRKALRRLSHGTQEMIRQGDYGVRRSDINLFGYGKRIIDLNA